jgi:hypothetical protein
METGYGLLLLKLKVTIPLVELLIKVPVVVEMVEF